MSIYCQSLFYRILQTSMLELVPCHWHRSSIMNTSCWLSYGKDSSELVGSHTAGKSTDATLEFSRQANTFQLLFKSDLLSLIRLRQPFNLLKHWQIQWQLYNSFTSMLHSRLWQCPVCICIVFHWCSILHSKQWYLI